MGQIYFVISQILLFWHAVWKRVVSDGFVLHTHWSWILAIVFLVLTVRAVLFPVFVKQIKSQRAMQAIQPKVKELQEKHKGDRESLQKELMELYRKEKANPLMGCLPLFLQIPVFLGLFHVLKHLKPGTSLDQKSLYGWTAKAFDSAANAKLFGAPISARFLSPQNELSPLGSSVLNVKIVAAALVAIMIVTTFLTSRQMILKTGWSEDPQQRMIQRLMLYGVPFSLLISGGAFPLGVVIYWVTTNLFSLGQQFWVLRKYPPPPMTKSAPGKATSASKSSSGLVGGRSGAAKPGTKAGPAKAGSTRSAGSGGSAKEEQKNGRFGLGRGQAGADKATPAKSGSGARGAAGKDNAARKDSEVAGPPVDGRSLAPKVGAKPVNPKKRPAKQAAKPPAKRPAS